MFIYKITNLINNKIYVGATKNDPIKRFKQHCEKRAAKASYLTKAILKYGRENFKVEILEEIQDRSILYKKEAEYITKLNSLKPNGYNLHDNKYGITNTGKVPRMTRKCLEAARNKRLGSRHSEKTRELMSISAKNRGINNSKAIEVINTDTNEVLRFTSINSASLFLNIKRTTINAVLTGQNKKIRSVYLFKYAEDK